MSVVWQNHLLKIDSRGGETCRPSLRLPGAPNGCSSQRESIPFKDKYETIGRD